MNFNRRKSNLATQLLGVFLIGSALVTLIESPAMADEPFDRSQLTIKDRLDLKSGSRLIGKFIDETSSDGRTFIVFKTSDGMSLKLDKARHVAKLYQLTVDELEYNKLVNAMADTADEHLRMYDWCADQKSGKYRYKDQIKFHLERIMELDPNDDKAKTRLGYMYLDQQGRWVPKKLYYDLNGYERVGSGWMPKLQAKVRERSDNQRLAGGDMRKKFKVWRGKLNKKKANRKELIKELFQFCDASSVNIIRDNAIKEVDDESLRGVYIEAIGKVKSYDAMLALGFFAIEDPNSDFRDKALTLLQQENFYSPDDVAAKLTGYLIGQSYRPYLLRAAYSLGEIGSDGSILPLVSVLITQHQTSALDDPNRMRTTFGNNGQLESFSTGGSDPKSKFHNFNNPEVVTALKKITGEDFGYKANTWKKWYVENHTLYNTSLRD